MAKVTVSIKGYGKVKVKVPKKLTKRTFSEGVAEATEKTLSLVAPTYGAFHPVMGLNYREKR